MNKLTPEKRCAVLRCLVDGCSIRATVRITGVSKNAIQRLTVEVGEACLKAQDKMLRDLTCKRLELDEVWCFCYAKDKNVPDEMRGEPGVGSIWTWTAICAESKLIVTWHLGARDAANAHMFIGDLKGRLANRVQITTDGNRCYIVPMEDHFHGNLDYAMLVKLYGEQNTPERSYSPAKCLGTKRKIVAGDPDKDLISTSYAERQNLNIRMNNRRYTRLTNAFSKKAEMLAYSVAIMFFFHNFIRKHQTLGTTPAVAAGIAKRVWKIEDMEQLSSVPMFAAG